MTSAGCNTPEWDLRTGDWREVLADVHAADSSIVVLTDPPYSPRTHEGQRSGGVAAPARTTRIDYEAIDEAQAVSLRAFCRAALWSVIFGDDETAAMYRAGLAIEGLYVFASVIWAKTNAAPRFSGDGPASQCEHLTVARPRRKMRRYESGSRPGWYATPQASNAHGRRGDAAIPGLVGEKPLSLMRALVRDYSLPGDLIVDPYAGSGTTILAAVLEGRRAIGAEINAERAEMARQRIARELAGARPRSIVSYGPRGAQEAWKW